MRKTALSPTAKYAYLFGFHADVAEPDNVYCIYGVCRNYFSLPDPGLIAGDFWLITVFGTVLHYRGGALVEEQPFPSREDSRFVWYVPDQVPEPVV